MLSRKRHILFILTVVTVFIVTTVRVYAQQPTQNSHPRYRVIDGVLKEVVAEPDSTAGDSTAVALKSVESNPVLSKEEKKPKKIKDADTSTVRYSSIFEDTIPISRMCLYSAIAPGFSQLYNKQAWKIPILYGTVGAAAYFGFQQNSKYRTFKKEYDGLIRQGASREELDPVQSQMIKHNTGRTLLFAGAIASYIYFIGDGALNYNGPVNSVKKATTLSTICPGAGQIYNKSYWKLPIVVGAFATMGYVIDFNARGYKRFKLAYDLVTDGDDSTVDEFNGRYSEDYLRRLKNSYRRNRDLSIIITCGLYLLNIIDAHVDAQLKDYDISDDLAVTLEPTLMNYYTMRSSNVTGIGLSLKINF